MKIVYFIDHLRPDGTQQVLRQLIEGLAARGHEQKVVCLNDSWNSELIGRLRAAAAEVRCVGKLALASGYGLLAIGRWLRREQFDVAVTLLFYSDVVGRTLAHMSEVPHVISSLRARNTNYAAWQRRLVRSTMRWADTVVLNSATVRDYAIAEEGAPPSRIAIIPNGVDLADYCTSIDPAALRAEFGIQPGQRLIGGVGRLAHQKGFDVLIGALGRLPRQDVVLLLLGAGADEARLRAQAAALGLAQRVRFAGYRRDVPRLLGALDLYVHPARFEGMPNALLEAMVAGCPIVASAVDGNRELIVDGAHGWLVPQDDVDALATAIAAALTDTAEARRRAAAAQQRAARDFSVTAMIDAWECILSGKKSPKTHYE